MYMHIYPRLGGTLCLYNMLRLPKLCWDVSRNSVLSCVASKDETHVMNIVSLMKIRWPGVRVT